MFGTLKFFKQNFLVAVNFGTILQRNEKCIDNNSADEEVKICNANINIIKNFPNITKFLIQNLYIFKILWDGKNLKSKTFSSQNIVWITFT